tara:strand:+ start:2252 stop:2461 length:210 start_codon:yes stop_codon:yes gene_type:complete
MGVIQKILSKAEVSKERGSFVEFELNEGGVIHIQNGVWRIEMQVPEFVEFAVACIEAGDNLKSLKNINE